MTETKQFSDRDIEITSKLLLTVTRLNYEARLLPQVSTGPIVTVYRLQPIGKTRVSHIEALANDFAVTLGVSSIMVKRLPGETAVAVFVPNRERTPVDFKDIVAKWWPLYHDTYDKAGFENLNRCPNVPPQIPLLLGVSFLGETVFADLAEMPHLLIAGSTGSGKSTLLSSIIAGAMYLKPSSELNFLLSDTKQVEFGRFIGAPHLLLKPATSIYQTLEQMDWATKELDSRLERFARVNCRNINEFNRTDAVQTNRLPRIVFVFDELAEILQAGGKEPGEKRGPSIGKIAEAKLAYIAQKARATGIHVIAATQQPSVRVVEGVIKANFPARISFRLPTASDSRTVFGFGGAEQLLSQGDMLFVDPNKPGLHRIHAPLAQIGDIEAAVEMAIRSGL